jgi:hypothetical protein
VPFVITQAVPHRVCPPEQLELQASLLQTCPAAQVVAQLPQWVASDETQLPLQSIPDWHWQVPAWQVCPVEQGMPQPPQLIGSAVTSTQVSPQGVWPATQPLPLVPAEPLLPVCPPVPFAQATASSASPSPKTATRAVVMAGGFPAGPKVIALARRINQRATRTP